MKFRFAAIFFAQRSDALNAIKSLNGETGECMSTCVCVFVIERGCVCVCLCDRESMKERERERKERERKEMMLNSSILNRVKTGFYEY